ncbi:unnamed protein product [Prunus armeniaca]|uniref:Uncharacterized protein n=1 Tax=Prunus armeniaca TaxID=36596 RepID=A0A6J5VZI0_PRUAR|nr:unnamed protein product [Prunus armeniaca]
MVGAMAEISWKVEESCFQVFLLRKFVEKVVFLDSKCEGWTGRGNAISKVHHLLQQVLISFLMICFFGF